MKLISYEKGHESALIFDKQSSAAVGELRDAKAVVKNGNVDFACKDFEKKIKALMKHGTVGITALVRNGQKALGRYFVDIENPEHIFSGSDQMVVESELEQFVTESNELFTDLFENDQSPSNVVGNTIDLEVDVPVRLFEELLPSLYESALMPIYASRTSNKVVGDIDTTTSEIALSDEYLVKRIHRSVEFGINSEIGISLHENEFFMDFVNPEFHLTKLMEVYAEGELDYEDELTGKVAHFINDDDAGIDYINEEFVSRAEINEYLNEALAEETRYREKLVEANDELDSSKNLSLLLSSISGKQSKQIFEELRKESDRIKAKSNPNAFMNASLGNSRSVEKVEITESTKSKPNPISNTMSAYLAAARF